MSRRWGSDPFSEGAYSFWATNSSQDDNDRLADPIGEGRVLFAGEATSDVGYFATVHGAYWSGQREAKRILNGGLTDNGVAFDRPSPPNPGSAAASPRPPLPAVSSQNLETGAQRAGREAASCALFGAAILHSWSVVLGPLMDS